VLSALECVDLVTIFSEVRATRFIEAVRPNVYIKGGDYTSATLDAEERATLEKIGTKIDIVPFEKGYSTSRLLEKLRGLIT
jgi:bifunctional ADP-heptose synthase (sugar kinase/adenylyltransferase)